MICDIVLADTAGQAHFLTVLDNGFFLFLVFSGLVIFLMVIMVLWRR